ATDEACGFFDGLVSPPAVVATKFLRGPLNELGQELGLSSIMPIYYNSPSLPPAMSAPSTPTEYYNYLSGTWRDGSELMVGGNGYQSDGATTTFAFPDLPSEAGGWSERAAGLPAGERTALGAYGPFELQPGAINEFTVFFNIADNPNAATIDDQIDQLFSNIDGAQQLYDNCFALDTEFNCFATSIQEQIARNESLELFPNPAREQVHLQLHQGTIEQVRLLGMDGKMLQQFSATNGLIEQIDIAHLRVGVYIVQVVTSEGKWANQKLVISR
ncbi:MAG: T9SS type A sorting domain-containing protein, partial [Bacteroidota bacterium]